MVKIKSLYPPELLLWYLVSLGLQNVDTTCFVKGFFAILTMCSTMQEFFFGEMVQTKLYGLLIVG